MKRSQFSTLAGLVLAASAAGCGPSDVTTGDELVRATVSLASTGVTAASFSVISGDSGRPGGATVIRPEQIDSLIVTVRRVEVLPSRRLHRCHPPVGDSVIGFRPSRGPGPGEPREGDDDEHRGPRGGFDDGDHGDVAHHDCRRQDGEHPFGPGGDDGFRPHPPERPDSVDVPPDSGWGSRPWHWFSLAVTGNGNIDLTNLPTDSANGIQLAAGDLPPGEYVAARLIVTSATIWLNTAITTDSGVTLQPNTGYPVKLPHRREGPMGILTRTGFTVPDGGGDVLLLFDPEVTIGHAVVTGNGTVLIRPVLKPLKPNDDDEDDDDL